MNNFKEFLTEGRFAPLYHSINTEFAINALILNRLEAHTNHKDYSGNTMKIDKLGISTTRSLKFALAWCKEELNEIVFEFDQVKLNQTNKIIPFSFFGNFSKEAIDDENSWYDDNSFPNKFTNQEEEFVIGDIKNLKRCLNKVIIYDPQNRIENFSKKAIINHTNKVYEYKNNRIIKIG